MAQDFRARRDALAQARTALADAHAAVLAAQADEARCRAEQRALARRLDPDDLAQAPGLTAAAGAAEAAAATLRKAEAAYASATRDAREATGAFAQLADPRSGAAQLTDGLPVLLFPLRLETRFGGGQPPTELWVRAYPDDCLVDSFEEQLSDAEIDAGERYWCGCWGAGGDEDRERAAWRALVAGYGSGRAAWIASQLTPLSPVSDRPPRNAPSDVILTVPLRVALDATEADAVRAYWIAIWRGAGDPAASAAAKAELETATSAVRAADLIASTTPENLTEAPAPPLTRADVAVSVAYLLLPPRPVAKGASWTQPATAALLPDRLVLLGWAGGELVLEQVGPSLPPRLQVGPDPGAASGDQLHGEDGELVMPDELAWLVDFDRAVADGLGFRVPLDERTRGGLERLVVLGLRLGTDAAATKAELETLLTHHLHGGGLALVPQGTQTNNTDGAPSGVSRTDDADASFADPFGSPAGFDPSADWLARRDGQWLADWLGIDPAALEQVPGAHGTDQLEARAMQTALWPATLGYATQTLLQPLLDDRTRLGIRAFGTRFVSGRGPVPAVRVGRQPYGILPATAHSRLRLGDQEGPAALDGLAQRLGVARADWTALAQDTARVQASDAPIATLLDVLGLQATSVEYGQRYAESLADLYNRANLAGLGERMLAGYRAGGEDAAAMELLARLGAAAGVEPEVLRLFFFRATQRLRGPLIEDRPLSETAGLAPVTPDGRGYIAWLADAARVSLETVRREQGFAATPPDALLYLLLRHAVLLGYWDGAVRLDFDAGVVDVTATEAARREPAFVHVAEGTPASESRYAPLYRADVRITGSDDQLVVDYIPTVLGTHDATRLLGEQLAALDVLREVPTARLERLLAEHVDLCSYRLDAWLEGLVHERLATLRAADGREQRSGLHVGAFGWLEDVRPKRGGYQPVELDAAEAAIFAPPGAPALVHDAANGGYLHAPSLNHAVTAAVLRGGYLANATPETPDALAIGLTSRRVRHALDLLEGMRNGQPLGALLGYQLERGLHDAHAVAEVDALILGLRTAFPLVANRLDETYDPNAPIEAIEASNVVDGLALALQVRRSGEQAYPYGATLPAASPAQAAAVDAEVAALLDVHDGVSDVLLAESVHQAVLGNHDRAAASIDSSSRTVPQEPAVVRTPRSGTVLTHRVGLQLEVGRDPLDSPVPGIAVTPRAIAQPALNAWLAAQLPPPADVGCRVHWTDPATGAAHEAVVTQADLALQPFDLLTVLPTEPGQAMDELDDRVLRHVLGTLTPRGDADVRIAYTERLAGPGHRSFFEVAPLVAALRSLVLRSRPLRASDVTPPGEASASQDDAVHTDAQPATTLRNRLKTAGDALRTLAADPRLADPAGHRDAAAQGIDGLIDAAADALAAASMFALPQAGFGDLYQWRAQVFTDVLAAAAKLAGELTERLGRFDQLMTAEGTAATDDEKMLLLQRAELLVATTATSPLPGTPPAYRPVIAGEGTTCRHRRDDLAALETTATATLSGLLAEAGAISLAGIDPTGLVLDPFVDRIVAFAASLHDRLSGLADQVDGRRDAAKTALDAYGTATTDRDRLAALDKAHKALLGDDARALGEFALSDAQAAEWREALKASTDGELLAHLTGRPFPVDDWLHGLARVRGKLHNLERAVLLGALVGQAEPVLVPMQLPHVPGEAWLGLEFPSGTTIAGERLLYTADYGVPFDATKRQCGLLLDEWTETLPAETETTGIAFHFDRPSSEPPQAWLLAVPPDPKGSWTWPDLVDTVTETLDLAHLRAVEPDQLDGTAWARFLPAIVSAATLQPITIGVDLGRMNGTLREGIVRDG